MRHQQQKFKSINKTPQEMLVQIRNLLAPHPQEHPNKHLSPNQIDQILKDSYQQSQVLKKIPSVKPITQQKIQQATSLLQNKNHSSFIQKYTKQKINSEMFSPLRAHISESQQQYYQRQRQELLRQRLIQQKQEQEKQKYVIEATKKFVRNQSLKLPYTDINQRTLKQGNSSITYLLNQTPQKIQISVDNRINESPLSNLETKYEQMKSSQVLASSASSKLKHVGDFIQIADDEDFNQRSLIEQTENNLLQALKRAPRFVKVFKQIIINQLILQKIQSEEVSQTFRSSLNRTESNFKYKNQPILTQKKINEPNGETVASLTRKYRSKGVVLKDIGFRANFKESKFICKKIINKMVGQGPQFHPKKAVLTETELSWCEQKQQIKIDSKKVQLAVHNIRVQKKKKQQGSFFSKKTTDIEVVVLQGNNRSITFQKNYLQGGELYEQLCNLMAQKIYNLSIIIACKLNQKLSDFIYNKKATAFDLSNEFLQSHDKYPNRDYRFMIISILVSLFPFRSQITKINLSACRTNVEENNQIFRGLCCSKLQQIVVSETKLNVQSLTTLCNFISTLTSNKVDVTLCNCMIDDQILQKSKQSFMKCTNIQKLNLSMNSFSLNGFSTILELCIQQKSCINELNVSQNGIGSLIVIGQLIKKCKKLQILIAENCSISFQSDQELKQFFQNCRHSRLKKLSLLRNELVNSLRYFQDFWVADSPKEINIDLGIYAQKTSKNLQGKLL